MINLLKNLLQASIKQAGYDKVSEIERQSRLKICSNCSYSFKNIICQHPDCGCYLPEKTSWATQECPICANCGRNRESHNDNVCFFEPKWKSTIPLEIVETERPKNYCCGKK